MRACSPGVNIGGVRKVTLSAVAQCEAAVGVVCDLVLEEASLDNMGNNESKDGVLPAKEGKSLTKFPTVEEERVAFLLYHMSIIPRAITHMPTITNIVKMI